LAASVTLRGDYPVFLVLGKLVRNSDLGVRLAARTLDLVEPRLIKVMSNEQPEGLDLRMES